MKKKTIFVLGATAILGAATLDIVNLPTINEPTVVYAATTTQKTALRKAKSYYKNMHMSKQGIFDQLTSDYDQYSEEDAQYAVDHLKANYRKAALKQAKSYQKNMAMSPDAIYDQLISENGEKFTEQEAQYAIDNLNK
ncbi:TPA: Ltp family lipoprotein [Streptococcus pyogenes]